MAALILIYVYLGMGLLFSLWFCFFKVAKVDEAASASSVWFKIMIMPGSMLLWPLVFTKLRQKGKPIFTGKSKVSQPGNNNKK